MKLFEKLMLYLRAWKWDSYFYRRLFLYLVIKMCQICSQMTSFRHESFQLSHKHLTRITLCVYADVICNSEIHPNSIPRSTTVLSRCVEVFILNRDRESDRFSYRFHWVLYLFYFISLCLCQCEYTVNQLTGIVLLEFCDYYSLK